MKTFPDPAQRSFCEGSYFKMSWFPSVPWSLGHHRHKAQVGPPTSRRERARLMILDLDHMDDGGMYVWAGIIALVAVVGGVVVAIAWQRWKDSKKARGE